MCEPWKPLNSPPARNGFAGAIGSAEPLAHWRRPMSTSLHWNLWTFELPGVLGGGMSGSGAADKAGNLAGCKSPHRQLPVFRRLAYLVRAAAVVPTAANTTAGQLGLLHPGLSCFVGRGWAR